MDIGTNVPGTENERKRAADACAEDGRSCPGERAPAIVPASLACRDWVPACPGGALRLRRHGVEPTPLAPQIGWFKVWPGGFGREIAAGSRVSPGGGRTGVGRMQYRAFLSYSHR